MGKHVLVVAPHADDEVLGCGVAIQKHLDRGDKVRVCVLTDRSYGHERYEGLVIRDRDQALTAGFALGLQAADYVFCGLVDENIGDIEDVIKPLEEVMLEFEPSVVYCPWVGDMNQDHKVVCAATNVVVRPHQPRSSVRPPSEVYAYETPSSTDQALAHQNQPFVPNWFLVATLEQLDQKCVAMRRYCTEQWPFPHPRSELGIRTYASFRGMQCGSEMAEAFMVLRYCDER